MIPKIIHYCWFGGKEIPEKDRKNIEGWKRLNPSYIIMRWDESNYNIHKNKYMEEAYSVPKWGFVPDYARTDIIYQYGGFYFDTDVELLKPLDELLNEKCVMGFEKKDSVNHGHGFGAEKGHPFLKEMLDFYDTIDFINSDGTLNMTASPIYITKLLLKHGLELNGKEQAVNDIHILPMEYFCPKDYLTGEINRTKRTIGIHHFNLSWMSDKDIAKMKEFGECSQKYGIFIARNIVDLKYAMRDGGARQVVSLLYSKIRKKIRKA